MQKAEWCGMGKGAGNRFPKQLRVKAPPRFHEALLRGIRVQVQHDFNAQAVAPAKLPIEVAAVFHFRIQGIGVGDSEMMAIALEEGGDEQVSLGRTCTVRQLVSPRQGTLPFRRREAESSAVSWRGSGREGQGPLGSASSKRPPVARAAWMGVPAARWCGV
jgi:hypothetical protein